MTASLDPNEIVTQQRWLTRILRNETVGGLLLLVCAVIALVWANSPSHASYENFIHYEFGPQSLGLHLPVHTWAADGLLAIFFFVAGVELKHEFVSGTLSTPRLAAIPMAAALGGMVVPALIFVAVNRNSPAADAWGLPMATDIAFALAVLAVVGRALPLELRAFLLTLAVVDDLGVITVIAIFYSKGFDSSMFVVAIIGLAIFGYMQSKGIRLPWLKGLLACVIWYATFRSGIHATVAGVAMGLLMRVELRGGETISPANRADDLLRPFSAGLCAPLFALVSTGIAFTDLDLQKIVQNPLTVGVVAGLLIGKPFGVMLGTFIATRFTSGKLPSGLSWWDILVIGTLASISFTVSLLINEVSFVNSSSQLDVGTFAIVFANVLAVTIASFTMLVRTRVISQPSK